MERCAQASRAREGGSPRTGPPPPEPRPPSARRTGDQVNAWSHAHAREQGRSCLISPRDAERASTRRARHRTRLDVRSGSRQQTAGARTRPARRGGDLVPTAGAPDGNVEERAVRAPAPRARRARRCRAAGKDHDVRPSRRAALPSLRSGAGSRAIRSSSTAPHRAQYSPMPPIATIGRGRPKERTSNLGLITVM